MTTICLDGPLRCPACDTSALKCVQTRAYFGASLADGCTVIDHGRGSVLVVTDLDMLHLNPAPPDPTVVLKYKCAECGLAEIELQMFSVGGCSMSRWVLPGDDTGACVHEHMTAADERRLATLRTRVDAALDALARFPDAGSGDYLRAQEALRSFVERLRLERKIG